MVANGEKQPYNTGDSLPGHQSPDVQQNKSPMKLSDVAYYVAHDGRGRLLVAESTYQRSYRPCMARFIEFFEDTAVTDLTREDLQDWLDWLDTRDISVVTRNSYARAARAIFNHLRGRDVPVCDPSGIFRMRRHIPAMSNRIPTTGCRHGGRRGSSSCARGSATTRG